MTPQPQTPLTRKASTIRSHSPYSTGKGPIVNEGFVAARVRAIQGGFKQAKSPQPKKAWDRSVHSLKESPSFTNFNQLSTGQDLNIINSDRTKRSQLASPRKWQRSTSSLRSPYGGLPTGLQPSDRKVHSMWDLHTRYNGSPHGGRKRYRDYSNLRRISAGTETGTSEIISPQPLSPYKQLVNVSQQNTDDSGFWSETQADQERSLPVSNPRKSIAEALDKVVDVTEGQDEASTAWATEDEKPEYPFPATEPFNDQSMPGAQRSEGGGPFDRKAYSQYIARTLPSFNAALTTASGSNDTDDERPLRKMRGRRAAPENTMVDSSEPDQQEELTPLLPLKKRSRAATASYSAHSVSDTPRRATMPAPSSDPFMDHHTYEDTDEVQKPDQQELKPLLPLKRRSRAATASCSAHSVSDTPRRATMPAPSIDPFIDHHAYEDTDETQDTLQEFKAYKATEDSKLRQRDAGSATSRDALELRRMDKPESSNSRRSSATSRAPSIALSRPLSRVWRRISSWRLGFGARQSESVELTSDQKSEIKAPSRRDTDLQPQVNQLSRKGSGRPRGFTYKGLWDLSTDSAASNMAGSETEAEEQPHRGSPKDQSLSSRSATPNPDELLVTEGEQVNEGSEDGHTLGARSHHLTGSGSSHADLTERYGREAEEPQELAPRDQSVRDGGHNLGAGSHHSTDAGRPHAELTERYGRKYEEPQERVQRDQSAEDEASGQGNAVSGHPSTSFAPQSSGRPYAEVIKRYGGKLEESKERVHCNQSAEEDAPDQGNAASSSPSTSLAPRNFVPSSNPVLPLTPTTSGPTAERAEQLQQRIPESPSEASKFTNEVASGPVPTPPGRPSRPPPLSLDCSRANSKNAAHSSHNPEPQQKSNHHKRHSPEQVPAPLNETPSTPQAPTDRRPPLATHISLKPSPAQPTTELSTPDPMNWTPSRGSVLSRTYSSLADRYHVQSATPSRAQSPTPSFVSETETVNSAASSEAYRSLKGSRLAGRSASALRSSSALRLPSATGSPSAPKSPSTKVDYELPRYRDVGGCRDREQRIKRVKVVVSLDGGPDLVVDAMVEEGREGGRAEWRVREGVRERVEVEG